MRTRPLALLAALLAIALPGVTQASVPPGDPSLALATSRQAIGRTVGDHAFTDTAGRPVRLGEYRGRPLLVSLVYTSCRHSCSVVTRQLAGSVAIAREALGDDAFDVVTVGFDAANDTPVRMAAYARQQGVDDPRWRFLSADAGTVDSLTTALGFTWFPSAQGFDHLAQLSLLDADGRVYRQIHGELVDVRALVEPLKELVWGQPRGNAVEAWVDTLKLFCTLYDPASGRYRFDYSVFVGAAIGVLCLGAVAVFLVHAWRQGGARGPSARTRHT